MKSLHYLNDTLGKQVTMHQVTTMLATSKNVPFPGHNHLLTWLVTTGADDPSLTSARAIIKVLSHQHRWLAGGYDLKIRLFEVAFLHSEKDSGH